MAHRLLAMCVLIQCFSYVVKSKLLDEFLRGLEHSALALPDPLPIPGGNIVPNCEGNGDMTQELREQFLSVHNSRRTLLGLGVVINPHEYIKPISPFARNASRMSKLKYNCDLEKSAYERASQCLNLNLSAANVLFENNHRYFKTKRTLYQAISPIIQRWWAEYAKLRVPIDHVQRIFYTHLGINSFAKIASDLTTEVGCAIVNCGSSFNAVCHYKTDLANTRKLYESGPSCSACPLGKEGCNVGLCTEHI